MAKKKLDTEEKLNLLSYFKIVKIKNKYYRAYLLFLHGKEFHTKNEWDSIVNAVGIKE